MSNMNSTLKTCKTVMTVCLTAFVIFAFSWMSLLLSLIDVGNILYLSFWGMVLSIVVGLLAFEEFLIASSRKSMEDRNAG